MLPAPGSISSCYTDIAHSVLCFLQCFTHTSIKLTFLYSTQVSCIKSFIGSWLAMRDVFSIITLTQSPGLLLPHQHFIITVWHLDSIHFLLSYYSQDTISKVNSPYSENRGHPRSLVIGLQINSLLSLILKNKLFKNIVFIILHKYDWRENIRKALSLSHYLDWRNWVTNVSLSYTLLCNY